MIRLGYNRATDDLSSTIAGTSSWSYETLGTSDLYKVSGTTFLGGELCAKLLRSPRIINSAKYVIGLCSSIESRIHQLERSRRPFAKFRLVFLPRKKSF